MRIVDPIRLRKFAGVKYIYGNPATGQRIKLDPKDFNEMQDIWLQHIDDFVRAMRGNEIGILSGCNVVLQPKQMTQALSGYELVVSPGEVYVNSALINVRSYNAVEVPLPALTDPEWQGFKTFYLILKPELREFVPVSLGDPGMSNLAGRKTTHRIEIGAELLLVDSIPAESLLNGPAFTDALLSSDTLEDLLRKNNAPWFVLLAEVRINNPISDNYTADIIVSQDGVHRLKVISEIQRIAEEALNSVREHLAFYYTKKELIGQVDGSNNSFTLPKPMLRGAETTDTVKNVYNGVLKIYANNQRVPSQQYLINTIERTFDSNALDTNSSASNTTTVIFTTAPSIGTILTASYYPEHHPQYLSYFSFIKHIDADSQDHDNRYYTEAEENAWRIEHNSSPLSHPGDLRASDFDAWKAEHIGALTTDHDNVYTRLGHRHSIEDTYGLTSQINKFGQEIGYGNDNYYVITQQIVAGIDGINKRFPLHSDILDSGIGYIKQVRADITNDAVVNPSVLSVIDILQDFQSPSVAAFSEPKALSMQNANNVPRVVAQSDDEIWVVWCAKESDGGYKIWFCSYRPGNGYFSPPTPTGLVCDPTDKYPASADSRDKYSGVNLSATVIYSSVPSTDQRIGIVWEYDGQLRYAYVDKGQTVWVPRMLPIPSTNNCHSPSIAWINDGTAAGKLHIVYTKRVAQTGKMAVYRRRFEIDFTEFGQEELISSDTVNHYMPIVVQDKSPMKKVWYAWITEKRGVPDSNFDNSHSLSVKIMDKLSNAIYREESVLGNINYLNMRSDIAITATPTNMWVQFSKIDGGMFGVHYVETTFDAIAIGDDTNPSLLATGQHHGVARTSNNSIWMVFDDIARIKYRARESGIGEVKWDNSNNFLDFERTPVTGSVINVDIAIPIRSLNERLSELESRAADSEEALAIKIKNAVTSMGLDLPQERFNKMREKIIVEAETAIDTRRLVLNYDWAICNKFFYAFDETNRRPLDFSDTVLKSTDTLSGFSVTSFENSGLEFDLMGRLTNRTGHIIKIYSNVYFRDLFTPNGRIRLEANGGRFFERNGEIVTVNNDLQCLDFRVTSDMTNDPTGTVRVIPWFDVTRAQLFTDLDWSANIPFTSKNNFGVEITIKPGGFIYDFALFLRQ